jgi:pyruvate/2-oxoglutarate dehydrogenase complex dihydrolipoamide acyltransferase (E2) component
MAIIRPLEGPGGEQRAEELDDLRRAESSEHAPTIGFTVPESVWDLDAVVRLEQPRPAEGPHVEPGEVAAAHWNHPSMWDTPAPQPPLTVVRADEPSPPAGAGTAEEPWLQSIVHAATSARSVDTADAWRAVASAADFVSEMARALEAVAQATQEAAQQQRAAREAAGLADEAEAAAQAAARHAESATRRARALDAAVAVARRSNSAESWGEVRRLAMDPWVGGAGDPRGVAPHTPDIA